MRLYGARLETLSVCAHLRRERQSPGRRRQGLQRPRFKDQRLLAVHSRARSVRASRPSTHDRLICGRRLMRIKRRASFTCRDGCWRKEPLHSDHGAGCVCGLARSVSRDPTTSSVASTRPGRNWAPVASSHPERSWRGRCRLPSASSPYHRRPSSPRERPYAHRSARACTSESKHFSSA